MKFLLLVFLLIVSATAEKTCPEIIPIFQGASTSVGCDTSTNPTGNTVDDPPCQYPQCTSDRSAVCGCVDYSQYGGTGMFWGCMHSRCHCPSSDSEIKEHDVCKIHGSDFQNPSFVGEVPVSGLGCQLGSRSGCLCKPVLGNDIPVEDWTWQCSSNIALYNENRYIVGISVASCLAVILLVGFILVLIRGKEQPLDISQEMSTVSV